MKSGSILNVTVFKSREKSLYLRHPWVFSGAIKPCGSHPPSLAHVYSESGDLLGSGVWNPHSGIRIRLYTFPGEEPLTSVNAETIIKNRIMNSVKRRLFASPEEAERLIFAESDGIPGFIADRYGSGIVVQFLSWSSLFFKEIIIKILNDFLQPSFIYERSDSDALAPEGLKPSAGLISGSIRNSLLTRSLAEADMEFMRKSVSRAFTEQSHIPVQKVISGIESLISDPHTLAVKENGLTFAVNIRTGHKTGMYIDQKTNRKKAGPYFRGDVLNVFSYTGGFTASAVAAGASSVTCVDESSDALITDYLNNIINFIQLPDLTYIKGDAFRILRNLRDEGRLYDCIILDPPKFAFSYKQTEAAAKGYKDINLLAMKLLKKGGFLITFSCSGSISEELFQKILFGSATDSGRNVQIVERLSQGPDHPVALNFPESFYLKGFILNVI